MRSPIKLYLLVFVLAAFIVGIGAYGIGALKTMNHNTQSLYADRVVCLQQLNTIRYSYATGVLSAVEQVQNHQITYAQATKQIEAAAQAIDTSWKAYMQTYLTPEETQLAAQNAVLMTQAGKTLEELKIILSKEDARGLYNIIHAELYPSLNPAINQTNKLAELQLRVSGELIKNSQELYASTSKKFYFLIAAALLFALVLSAFIVGDTFKLIKNLEASNRKIAESEAKCRAFIKYAGDSIFILDTSLRITDANDSAVKLTGYTRSELFQLKITDIISKDELPSVAGALNAIEKEGGSLHQRKFKRKDGSIIETEVNVRVVEGVGFISIVRDITDRKKAEFAIKESEEKYRSLIEQAGDAIFMVTNDASIADANTSAGELLGYTREELRSMKVLDVYPPDQRGPTTIPWDLLKQHKTLIDERTLQCKDGTKVEVEINRKMVNNNGYLAIVRDISERKRIEKAVTESEIKFRNIFENAVDVFFRTTIYGIILEVSPSAETLVGLTRQQLIGTPVSDLYYDQTDKEKGENLPVELKKSGETKGFELRFKSATGRPVYVSINARLIPDGDGGKMHIDGLIRDVTEQKRAEAKIQESEEKFRLSFMTSSNAFYIRNMQDGRLIEVNDAYCSMFGYSREELIGQRTSDLNFFINPDDQAIFITALREKEYVRDYEMNLRKKDGGIITISASITLWKMRDEEFLLGALTDITERKKVEQAIKESEQNYRSLFEQASDMIVLTDLKAHIIDINNSGCQLLGYTRREMIGKRIEEFIEPEHLKNDPIILEELLQGKHNIRRRLARRKNGETFEVESNTKRIFGDRILVIARDITDLRIVEKQIEQSEEKHRALIENISDAIMLLNENAETIYQSPSVQRIVGYMPEEAREKKVFEFVHPDDLQITLNDFQQAYAAPGVPVQNQFRVQHKDGHFIWIEGTIMNLLHNESVKAFVVIYRDITERKKAEHEIASLNESLEQKVIDRTTQLQEANKALEAFSYSVSHDLRAPVRAVIGFTKIIRQTHASEFNEDLKELFEHIETSGHRMNAIIEDMLTLAKYDKAKLRPAIVDMGKLVNAVWNNIHSQTQHHAKLQVVDLPTAEADVSMLEQVVVNLISNAVKYSSKKEQPVVSIGYEKSDSTVTFFVKDNGAGFDMKNYDRLFGAFQRLHGMSEFEGTGVGLTLVKRIIEKHGGIVWAEGKVNEGATFYFSLPSEVSY